MKRSSRLAIWAVLAALFLPCSAAFAQNGSITGQTISSTGRPAGNVNVAICQPLTTTAASVSSVSGLATLSLASNPLTQGFVVGATMTVSGFTGGDTYFNGSFPIVALTSSMISYSLVHATASASSNGTVSQSGTVTQACAALVSLTTDNTGNFSAPNPFTTDGLGNYTAWAAPGFYKVQTYGANYGVNTYSVGVSCVPQSTVNCGTSLTAANTWTASQTFKGPSPWVDVAAYGARPLATNLGTLAQTGSINSASTGLTLNAVGQYQNGDNIVIAGAGSGNSVGTSAPVAPTVTPSIASGPLNSGEVANSATGGTTYSYEMMWCDLATMACTPPSTATTIANGQATLGEISLSVTSISRSGTTATVTTAAHTLSTAGCSNATCAYIHIYKGSDSSFSGFARIQSAADTTHFTYTTPGSTTYGATASSTGGTFQYFQGNHIACGAAPTVTSICVVYGRQVGSFTFIGAGRMGETFWDDWGTTISGNPLRPPWIPNTPPATFQNNSLNTTISSGAGTTSVTLAASASTSVTSQYTTIDQCPNLLSAATATNSSGAAIYIPPTPTTGPFAFVIGSYCSLPSGAQVRQAGKLWLTSPIALNGQGTRWIADHDSNLASAIINVSNTSPGLYLASTVQQALFDGWNLQSQNANNAVLVLSDQGGNVTTTNFTYGAGSGGNVSYLGMSEVVRSAGFDNYWTNGVWTGDYANAGTNLGDTTAPNLLLLSSSGGPAASLTGHTMFAKGIAQTGNQQMTLVANYIHLQGPVMPAYTTESTTTDSAVELNEITNDSSAAPIFTMLTAPGYLGVIKISFPVWNTDLNGWPPLSSGGVINDAEVTGLGSHAFGQNFNVRLSAATFSGMNPYTYQSQIVPSGNPSVFGVEQLVTTTSAVVGGGGSVPVGTFCYSVGLVYASGARGLAGNTQCATTTPGNQTVTVSWTLVPVPGAKYNVYRSDGGSRAASSENLTSSPYIDTFASGYGDSFPSFSPDGYPSMGSNPGTGTPTVLAPTLGCGETTAPTGVAAADFLYCDSTAHQFKTISNNGTADIVGDTIVENCGATSGATQNCAKTRQINPIIVFGDVTLNTATTQSITTLPFTSGASYSCSGSDLTTTTGTVFFNTYAAASVTIGENGGVNTDHLRYICSGF